MQTNKTRKLGVFVWFGYQMPIIERARIIREAGFETVLHWWDDSFIETARFSKEEQVDRIRSEGLLHIPFSEDTSTAQVEQRLRRE
jgi:hypothetical protein